MLRSVPFRFDAEKSQAPLRNWESPFHHFQLLQAIALFENASLSKRLPDRPGRSANSLSVRCGRLRRHARARPSAAERTGQSETPSTVAASVEAARLAPLAPKEFARDFHAIATPSLARQHDRSPPQFLAAPVLRFNVWSLKKRVEKLHYMHMNPVKRGLVPDPKLWPWSNYRFYQYGNKTCARRMDCRSRSKARRGKKNLKIPTFRKPRKMGHPKIPEQNLRHLELKGAPPARRSFCVL